LLVSADFENGLGMRLSETIEFPYNMALAAAGDVDLVYQMGKIISEEARAIGVHQNFAPVADINNNYLNPVINVRSFSDNKDIVSRFVSNFVRGSKQTRTISTVKHFPGHGNTNIDSHRDLPRLNIERLNLVNHELVPFTMAIKAGVQSVMMGHIEIPSIEPTYEMPATLSYRIVTDLLQNELGFDGLIVTDAMDMSAVTKYFSDDEAAVLAVMAGNDIILMPRDPKLVVNSIVDAVEDGKISEERINTSVRKILSAKKWLRLDKDKFVDWAKAEKIIMENKHFLLANEIAEKSITLVKDKNNIIPVDPSKIYRTASIYITNGSSGKFFFENLMDENFGYINKIIINSKSRQKDYDRALSIAQNSDVIIIPSFVRVKNDRDNRNAENNFNLINKILELNKPAILVSFGDPYLLSYFPQAETYLCSYGNTEVSQRAMMNALLGKISVQGTLPISIPGTEYDLKSGKFVEQTELNYSPFEKDYFSLESADVAMLKAIEDKVFPGGVLLIGKRGKVIYQKPFGRFSYDESSTLMSDEAIFDLSSLTKTVAARTAAMILYDEEKLNPDFKVSYYLEEFGNNGKENIPIKDLILNLSVLPKIKADINQSRESFSNSLLNSKAEIFASENYLNFIVLQLVIEKIAGKSLDTFLKEKLFIPLKLEKLTYNPPKEFWYYTPPTSEVIDKRKRNKGMPYDTAAFVMDGVTGHSGLFSTVKELAVYSQLILQNGHYMQKQWIRPSTIQEFINYPPVYSSENNTLLLTGETGTSIYLDMKDEVFIILLTNSIYPEGNQNRIIEFRNELHKTILSRLKY
jgi:beta-N-acetylhexosaminidase